MVKRKARRRGGGGRADEHGSTGGCRRFMSEGGPGKRQAPPSGVKDARAALAATVTKVMSFGRRRSFHRQATSRMHAPFPGLLSIVSFAPAISACSRMPTRPK
jgi:hypothetical protein